MIGRLVDKAPSPRVRSETFRISVLSVVGLFLAAHLARAGWFLVRQWPAWLSTGLALLAFRLHDGFGPHGVAGGGVGLVLALIVWALAHRRSFQVVVYWPLRGWLRGLAVYAVGWHELMAVCGLAKTIKGQDRAPRLIRTRSTSTVDRVRVKTLRGQTLSDFADNADRFAANVGALDCRVRSLYWPGLTIRGRQLLPRKVRARVLDLWFLIKDPLADAVALFDVSDKPNLKKLTMALREDGLPWALRLLGTHVLIAGRTGAGKGSVLWSLIRSLGHAVRSGLVELWVVDPKGGMELAAGQAMFARYCYGDNNTDDDGKKRAYQLDFAEFLESVVETMQARQRDLRGRSRTHKAKPGDPHIVVVIDELACLTAYVTDRESRKRIDVALGMLLSQGRAVGISVVAALQDARKEVLPDRGLFPTRIALALNEPEETDLVLGSTARKNGARCDEISEDTPGVAFVAVEETREPVRVRFGYVDDDEIARMATEYRPGATPIDPYPSDTALTEEAQR